MARTKDNTGDNAGDKDRARCRTKAKNMISVSEVVYLYTKSIIELMLHFFPLLLSFCINKEEFPMT